MVEGRTWGQAQKQGSLKGEEPGEHGGAMVREKEGG